MYLRRFQKEDLQDLIALFKDTVQAINSKDYSEAEIQAWITSKTNFADWLESLTRNYCLLAIDNQNIVGFGDITADGYLDRLFVHRDFQGQGIATVLCDQLELQVKGAIVTHASITAKVFFEKRGYRTIKEQKVFRNGVWLKNYVMQKD